MNLFLKGVMHIICKVEYREFYKTLSKNKPLILAINHVNFLEVPMLVSHGYPLYLTGLAKAETWKNPLFSFLFNTYKAIPIDREGSFQKAFDQVSNAISKGFYVIVAPEGTRSKDGVLRQGKAGIIRMALEADSPVLPVAHYGGENIWKNIKRFRRTPFCIKAGRPFKIKYDGVPGKSAREAILDEIMGQMASLLPEDKRGIYASHAGQECRYLEFLQ